MLSELSPPLSSVEVHTRQAVVILGRRADDWSAIAECCGLKAGATDLAVSVAQSHRGAPCAGMSSPLRLGVPEREAGGRTHTAPARRLLTPTTSETSSFCRFKDGLTDSLSHWSCGSSGSWGKFGPVRTQRIKCVCVGWVERRKVVEPKNESGGGKSGRSQGWASTAGVTQHKRCKILFSKNKKNQGVLQKYPFETVFAH